MAVTESDLKEFFRDAKDVTRVTVAHDEFLVIKLPEDKISDEAIDHLKRGFERSGVGPKTKVLVVPDYFDFTVVKQEEINNEKLHSGL